MAAGKAAWQTAKAAWEHISVDGSLIVTGPTGTNVNDVAVVLIDGC